MKVRNSARGQFLGCSRFPTCRGTRNVSASVAGTVTVREEVVYDPIAIMSGSDEQEAIWDYLLNGESHVIIGAGPGTGKTWTSVQYCLRAPRRLAIQIIAFNKHIATEANGKLRASGCNNATACTTHSLGLRMLRDRFPGIGAPNADKMQEILELLSPEPTFDKGRWRRTLNMAARLCGYTKNYLLDFRGNMFTDELETICDHHGVETGGVFSEALPLVVPALEACIQQAGVSVDFDDMIWLPVMLDLTLRNPAAVTIIDELQDCNKVQHQLALRAAGGGRIVGVGDHFQAIYAFRGSATESMADFTRMLSETDRGVVEFPLTITRRCPKSHVRLARALSPNIQALDDAPEGVVMSVREDDAIAMMEPGDMVICRINAPLIHAAYELIKRGVRPVIKGRDIGKGLTDLAIKLKGQCEDAGEWPEDGGGRDQMRVLRAALRNYHANESARLATIGEKAQGRIAALDDKCSCMLEFIAGADDFGGMIGRIDAIFQNFEGKPANSVVLGTVHRTKGLEAERVFVLTPKLIPHPMASKSWEVEQETHIAWIAATRAKFTKDAPGTLVFCGHVPDIYNYDPEE